MKYIDLRIVVCDRYLLVLQLPTQCSETGAGWASEVEESRSFAFLVVCYCACSFVCVEVIFYFTYKIIKSALSKNKRAADLGPH